jgi:hypothetical protein
VSGAGGAAGAVGIEAVVADRLLTFGGIWSTTAARKSVAVKTLKLVFVCQERRER